MTDKVLIDRALLQDLIDDVSDYAESRVFKQVEWKWRTELLEKARALLAAGASEGQAEPVAWAVYWGIGNMRPNSVHFEKETAVKVASEIKSHTELRPLYTHPSTEIAALRERIAGMEKDAQDAARYRWLEGQAKCDPKMGGNHHWWGINLRGVHGPTLAIGIDAAIAKEQK